MVGSDRVGVAQAAEEPACRAVVAVAEGGHDHGEDQDAAEDHVLVGRVDVEEGQRRADDAEQHDAEEGAERRAATTGEGGTAEDHGGDGLELEPGADSGIAGPDACHEDHPGDGDEGAVHHEGDDLGAIGGQTRRG